MKNYIILILLSIFSSITFSQDTLRVQQATLDSLQLLFRNHPETDTIRVNYLIDYAQMCYYNMDLHNAFQACYEKSESLKLENQKVYKPLVTVKSFYVASLPTGEAGRCEICISDNGPGIPDHIKDKIFQPFFTTKPSGQGTGLGLSLAYDIVKAHGGEITVESKNGYGTEFIIKIPITL